MFTNQEITQIRDIVREFFEKMTIPVEIKVGPLRDQTLPVDLETEDPKILIGEGGQTLIDVQKIIKVLLRRKTEKSFYVDLDVNSYKKKKIVYLKETARSTADEVALNKKEIILASMPAYERRIVHLELADRENIATESIGEEPERKIAIRPYP